MIYRRKFLKDAGIALSLSLLGSYGLDITHRTKPWRVALIGTGWYGKSDLMRLMQVANIQVVGLCDVDKKQLKGAVKLIQERTGQSNPIPCFQDYRILLAQEGPEIVIIGTPDHWHALQAIEAMNQGAHIYLQKPISLDIAEGEALLEVAKKTNRIIQIGTQRRSTHHLIEAKEKVIDRGLLGKIGHVEMCCYYPMRANRKAIIQDVPDYLDYEMYVGPAKYRAYDGLPHRSGWRALTEYSNGIMGDMCVHMYDTVRWLLNLGWPESVFSTGGIYNQKESFANTSDTQTAIFKHDQLNCTWQHRSWGQPTDPEYPWAFFIYGEHGTLKGSVHKFEFIANNPLDSIHSDVLYQKEEYPEDLNEVDIELHVAAATRNHFINFLYAIETKSIPVSNLLEGHISTASCILANLSMGLERPLSYDHNLKIITNDNEATKLLKRNYRAPWQHPYKS